MDLSIVIPIKDEKDNIRKLHERITAALQSADAACGVAEARLACYAASGNYEIVLVDDGSTDGSHLELEAIAALDPRVKVVRLRRNFGQTPALQAGIDFSAGDVIVTMDGDLQNDPADIPMLLDKLSEGYDAVFGLRAKRQDHLFIRKIPSRLGNWLIRKVTGSTILDMGCTLRALRRDQAESLPLYGELHRFVPVLAQQAGARIVQVPVNHHPRTAGKTKYNLTRAFRVILDLITVKFLHSYFTRPMHVMGLAGLFSMALGGLFLLAAVVLKYTTGLGMTANPMFLFGIMLEVIGVQFISLGLIGEMMTRTYFESQGKKAYTVRNTLNFEPRDAEPSKQRRAA